MARLCRVDEEVVLTEFDGEVESKVSLTCPCKTVFPLETSILDRNKRNVRDDKGLVS